MKKYIILAILLCYPPLTLRAAPTSSVPISSSSSTTTLPYPGMSCNYDYECNDLNPCTFDYCEKSFYECKYSSISPSPTCNDGLYCTGIDICGDGNGLCSVHSGDPCPAGTVCNEDTDSCDTNPVTTTTTSTNQTTTTTVLPPDESFSITGHVRGDIEENVTVLLAGIAYETSITDTDGYYEFLDLAVGYYMVKPEKDGYSFEPPNYVIQNLTRDLVNMNFEATKTRCLAQSIYGEDSYEGELLRSLRDKVLSKTQEGRELIKLYYQWSPYIVRAMEADEDFKEDIREMVDEILLLMD